MQAYMKSALPYRGLTSPGLRAALRPLLADAALRLPDRATWVGAARTLWDEARYREEWYAAIALLRHRAYAAFRGPDCMPVYRHFIVTGAWWDFVDDIATHLVREVLLDHPSATDDLMREWARTGPEVAGGLWLRRTAIICQVGAGPRVRRELLADSVAVNIADRDFFIRKAIGWALRDYARTDPAWVTEFLSRHHGSLSGLSIREAAKHLTERPWES